MTEETGPRPSSAQWRRSVCVELLVLCCFLHTCFAVTVQFPGVPVKRSRFGSVEMFSPWLISCVCPSCRVSPANEGGVGRGGRVHLLPGSLGPGEQRLRQLLHQTGALRRSGDARAHLRGKLHLGSGITTSQAACGIGPGDGGAGLIHPAGAVSEPSP